MNMTDEALNLITESSINVEDIQLDAADESAIFLAALEDACDSQNEYETLVQEAAVEMELYGLIDNAEVATEAVKMIKFKQTKQMNLNREQSKAAFRLAAKANSAHLKKYKKHRKAMLEAREAIFTQFGPKAKSEAKRVLNNSRRKASANPSVNGQTITKKMDEQIKKMSS